MLRMAHVYGWDAYGSEGMLTRHDCDAEVISRDAVQRLSDCDAEVMSLSDKPLFLTCLSF